MSGTVLVLRALVRNERIQSAFQPVMLGPTIGVTVSRARTRWKVRVQPALKSPAAAVFQVRSGSFHSSQPSTLVTVLAASRADTMVSTLDIQSVQDTQRYGKSG